MLEYKFTEKKEEEKKPRTFVEEILQSISKKAKKEKEEKKKKPRLKFLSKESKYLKNAKTEAMNKAWLIYDIAKQAWGMMGWPDSQKKYKL